MKRIGLSLAALFLTAHLASASDIVNRFIPADDTTINPNVFSWTVKPYLFGDDLPETARIDQSDLVTILNAHIVDNGGEPLTQGEIDDLADMKTYYLSLSTAARALYLDSLEGVSWNLQQGLLALTEPDPAGFWDELFLGIAQQQQQGLALNRASVSTGGTYDQVDREFAEEVQSLVGGGPRDTGTADLALQKANAAIAGLDKMRPGVQQAKVDARTALQQNVTQQQQINALLKKK